MRAIRGGTLGALALTAMLPMFHGVGTLGWDRTCAEIGAQWYLAEGFVLLFGFTMFVGRLPERLSSGSFEVFGHSHQIHHVWAVVGQAFYVTAFVLGDRFQHVHPNC